MLAILTRRTLNKLQADTMSSEELINMIKSLLIDASTGVTNPAKQSRKYVKKTNAASADWPIWQTMLVKKQAYHNVKHRINFKKSNETQWIMIQKSKEYKRDIARARKEYKRSLYKNLLDVKTRGPES